MLIFASGLYFVSMKFIMLAADSKLQKSERTQTGEPIHWNWKRKTHFLYVRLQSKQRERTCVNEWKKWRFKVISPRHGISVFMSAISYGIRLELQSTHLNVSNLFINNPCLDSGFGALMCVNFILWIACPLAIPPAAIQQNDFGFDFLHSVHFVRVCLTLNDLLPPLDFRSRSVHNRKIKKRHDDYSTFNTNYHL